ncbi:YraN family protein [Paraburkholderia sp.]|uniref:YraN family protein n=1 Tax=Paraburkholderia sp. TaxID=1926495 RepID=UPI002392CF4C|nr:YraN family protein [Paraburkholderia sp.]MDE1181480.1 YraN family protein [Paraburkholderia sp.]
MRQKSQKDGTRPTLCHADLRGQGGGASMDVHRGKPDEAASRATASAARACAPNNFSDAPRSKDVGAAFEAHALDFLRRQRLRLVARNVSCRGGEIDLVMRERDDSLVFVEVRARAQRRYGGAAASVDWRKRRRIVCAAQYFLASRDGATPACRFDVVAFEGGRLVWLRDAFRLDEC